MIENTKLILSILVPVYNRATHLDVLLNSIAKAIGGDPRVECLVRDNASTDKSFEIAMGFSARSDNFHAFRNSSNLGYGRNTNLLVEAARGEYCWILGSDDMLDHFSQEALFAALHDQFDIVFVNAVSNTGKKRDFYYSQSFCKKDAHITDLLTNFRTFSAALSFISTFIFKRDIYLQYEHYQAHDYTHFLNLYAGIHDRLISYIHIEQIVVKCGAEKNDFSNDLLSLFYLDTNAILTLEVDTGSVEVATFLLKLRIRNTNFEFIKSKVDSEEWRFLRYFLEVRGYKVPRDFVRGIKYALSQT